MYKAHIYTCIHVRINIPTQQAGKKASKQAGKYRKLDEHSKHTEHTEHNKNSNHSNHSKNIK